MGDTLAVSVLVMGGLFIGLFTPTKASAVGAFGVPAVSLIRWIRHGRAVISDADDPDFFPVIINLGYDPI